MTKQSTLLLQEKSDIYIRQKKKKKAEETKSTEGNKSGVKVVMALCNGCQTLCLLSSLSDLHQ